MRDPARAAALGLLPQGGASFGNEGFGADYGIDLGGDFGGEFGGDMGFGGDFGDDMHGDIGAELGADFGARRRRHPRMQHGAPGGAAAVSPEQLAKLVHFYKSHRARQHHAQRRMMLLDPNAGSSTKIERYTFSVVQSSPFTFGTPASIYLSGQPATSIRPQRLFVNVPCPFFASYSNIKVANVSVNVGNIGDAWEFAGVAVGLRLDMPTLTPANALTFEGNYTGLAPVPYTSGDDFDLVATVHGPATIAG